MVHKLPLATRKVRKLFNAIDLRDAVGDAALASRDDVDVVAGNVSD